MKHDYRKARFIKQIMTTPEAGCYRLERLPKSATLKAIDDIYRAMTGGGDWAKVRESRLYQENGSAYCHILAAMHYYYGQQ